MGAVVCGGWKGHSHTWEVVGIVASWGIVEGAEAAFLVPFLVRVSSRLVRYISVTQAHHPKQPLRLAG